MISFDTDKEKQDAIASFTNLINSDGWKLVVKLQEQNIQEAIQQLETGLNNKGEEVDIDLVRLKLMIYREMLNFPQIMIQRLEMPVSEPDNPDPFDTLEDVQDRKKIEVDKEIE